MRTVNEVSKLTGVSVRTLHHYDAIGLLEPSKVTEAGYRLYDDTAIGRLQAILMFRELKFPLKEIKNILDSPAFDQQEALSQQIHLLKLQQKRIGQLISLACEIQKKGVNYMNFQAFDTAEIDQFSKEVKERWGSTAEYTEYQKKSRNRTSEEQEELSKEMMKLFFELGKMRALPPTDSLVQEKIDALRQFITKHYYTCSKEVFQGLGSMYVCDDRMKKNIDAAGGDGTAEFVNQAIIAYCC